MNLALRLENGDPSRLRASQIAYKYHGDCSREGHATKLAGIPRYESEVVAKRLRDYPDDTDFLHSHGALDPLLRDPEAEAA